MVVRPYWHGGNRASTAPAAPARVRVLGGAATSNSKVLRWSQHPRHVTTATATATATTTWRIPTSRTLILLCLMLYLVTYKTLHDLMEDYAASSTPGSQSSRHNNLPPLLRALSHDPFPQKQQQQQQRRASVVLEESPTSSSSSSSQKEWNNRYNLVHVVQTRFMQHQPNLTTLAHVRLQLFQIFCWPLLVQHRKSSAAGASFVWMIRIDPQLDSTVVQSLIQLFEQTQQHSQSQVLIIASNDNPKFRQEQPDPSKLVYGNMHVWESYYTAAAHHTVLETRLDADDGIPLVLVEQLQRHIYQYLQHAQLEPQLQSGGTSSSRASSQARVYCVDAHIEWHQPDPNRVLEGANMNHNATTSPASYSSTVLGQLVGIRTPHCVTPGLTFVYPPGYENHHTPDQDQHVSPLDHLNQGDEEEDEIQDEHEQHDLPTKHHLIHKRLPQCVDTQHHYDPRPCFVRFKYNDWPMAIRARTMTSAGMNRVMMPEQLQHNRKKMWSEQIQQAAWHTVLPELFDIHASQVLQLIQTYFAPGQQQVRLAQQALQGQCTPGHSCKQGAKVALQAMMRHVS